MIISFPTLSAKESDGTICDRIFNFPTFSATSLTKYSVRLRVSNLSIYYSKNAGLYTCPNNRNPHNSLNKNGYLQQQQGIIVVVVSEQVDFI